MLLKDFLQKYNLDLKSLLNNFDWFDVCFQYCYTYCNSNYVIFDKDLSSFNCFSYKKFIEHIDNYFELDEFLEYFSNNCDIDIIYHKSDYFNFSILNDDDFTKYLLDDFSSCILLLNYYTPLIN